jgi:hypothetical protein
MVLDILYGDSSRCVHCPEKKSEMDPRRWLGKSINLISLDPFLNLFGLAF